MSKTEHGRGDAGIYPQKAFSLSKTKEKDYQAIINAMIDTAWVIDMNGNIVDVNDSAVSLLGYTREELLQIGLPGIDASLSQEQILDLVQSMPEDKQQIFETTHKTKAGKVIPVEICSSLVHFGGHEVILSIARDITERKWAEQKIRKQLNEKETLLRAIHHRVKNNIASIESLLSIQARSIENEEAQSIIQNAIGRVSCVRILYETLLKAQNYSELSVKSFLCSILEKIVELYSKGEAVEIETDMEEFQITQRYLFPLGVIFEELLTNVFKYAFEDIEKGRIRILLKKNTDSTVLEIHDNGKGLPKDFNIEKTAGFGLRIVKMLSSEIDADFRLDNHDGTQCRIIMSRSDNFSKDI